MRIIASIIAIIISISLNAAEPVTLDFGRFTKHPTYKFSTTRMMLGAKPYTDRTHTIKTMPKSLTGATLITSRYGAQTLGLASDFTVSRSCFVIAAVGIKANDVNKYNEKMKKAGWKPLSGKFETTEDKAKGLVWAVYYIKSEAGKLPRPPSGRRGLLIVK